MVIFLKSQHGDIGKHVLSLSVFLLQGQQCLQCRSYKYPGLSVSEVADLLAAELPGDHISGCVTEVGRALVGDTQGHQHVGLNSLAISTELFILIGVVARVVHFVESNLVGSRVDDVKNDASGMILVVVNGLGVLVVD